MWSTDRLRPAAALAAALALSACASAPPTNGRVADPRTPLDQYPVQVSERPETLAIAVHPAGGLSPAQQAALAGFAQAWRDAGGSAAVVVQSPAEGGPDAQLTAQGAADRLVALGVAPAALRLGPYPAGASGAPVTLGFERLVAEGPDCDRGWGNLVSTNSNDVTSHFGCAAAHNLAAMIADPRDLQGPRPMTAADAGRRAAVLDKYRQGAITASAKDDQANGAVSKSVN